MNKNTRIFFAVRCLGLALLLPLWMTGQAAAQDRAYLPNGPDVPKIALNEGPSGAAGLPPLHEPAPNPPNQQSIWNMEVVGHADNQGRAEGDQEWIENQHGRYILYTGNGAGSELNPATGAVEPNGTAIYDVTDPTKPTFLHNIMAKANGAPHAFVCGGDTLPNGKRGHFYLLRDNEGPGATQDDEIWDVTDPAAPTLLTTIVSGLTATHKSWWECDTGIAYLIGGTKADGWHPRQHVKIYNLSNPEQPVYIRDYGLLGQQPGADVATAKSCTNNPGPNCFEGVTNPPQAVHEAYSAGKKINRVYLPYGVGADGVLQIVDRQKLLTGCTVATASPDCATHPTQADMLYPQVSYITENPTEGGHDANPIFGVPIPQQQSNFLDGSPVNMNLLLAASEAITPLACMGMAEHSATLLDIGGYGGTSDKTPWPIATLNVSQQPGDFCKKGSRFGSHHNNWEIYAPYYGKLAFVTFFDAGLRVWDIRDPFNPRPVAYFIQAPNRNTKQACGTYKGHKECRTSTEANIVELDDRGYVYLLDRPGTGVTILKPTGAALQAVTATLEK